MCIIIKQFIPFYFGDICYTFISKEYIYFKTIIDRKSFTHSTDVIQRKPAIV